jgi:cell division protein FtsL
MPNSDTPKTFQRVLLVVLLVAVLISAGTGIMTALAVRQLTASESSLTDATQEDNVSIMGEYTILSTLPISDAYHSGSDASLNSKEKETLSMASAVLDEIITEGMTDYEKEKAVYDWMTSELSYDTGVLQVIPATEADCDNPYGVLKYHNAVCVGYATTFRLFMQMMDIECMVIHNTQLYHSWNLVKLGDDWYQVDIYSDEGEGHYANFNMNDEQSTANGHEWDTDFFPAATGLEYNYAYQNRTVVTDIYDIPSLVRQAVDEETAVSFLGFDAIDETHAQLVERMLQGSESAVMDLNSDLWMTWNWSHIANNEYLLTITLYGFDENTGDGYDISDEDMEKIDQAVVDAFGESPDWDYISDQEGDYGMIYPNQDGVEVTTMDEAMAMG